MINLNLKGKVCPLPVIETKKALEKSGYKESVEVLVDNKIAVENLEKLAVQKKLDFKYTQINTTEFVVSIYSENQEESAENATIVEEKLDLNLSTNTVVISANTMGSGDDNLGKALLKGFIFALTQLKNPPETIIFYNSGCFLTCIGSDNLEDLKNLQDIGVKIYTCGACLNHYNLAEKLAVGEVTNMYFIVEILNNGQNIIRP